MCGMLAVVTILHLLLNMQAMGSIVLALVPNSTGSGFSPTQDCHRIRGAALVLRCLAD